MSNILIIKHGSLGDIAQISGVLKDIREANRDKKIFILTTLPYVELMGRCPFVDGVLIDKRLPRWNLLYLIKLRKMINFRHINLRRLLMKEVIFKNFNRLKLTIF